MMSSGRLDTHLVRCWKVVGGTDTGGIIVRHAVDRQSPLHEQRLATAAVVREIKLQDGRLQYKLVSGSGPEEGWVSIRAGAKDLMVPVVAAPIRSEHLSRRPLGELSYDERHSIQQDLLKEYSNVSFQRDLHEAWNAANGDESKQTKRRWAVCWGIQAPIFKEHRFAGSPHDVLQSNACISVDDADSFTSLKTSEREAGAWLMWLIHPPAQVVHPNGPPSAATASEMLHASVPGLSSQLPKAKVLGQVPCKHEANKSVYSIRVVGGMTGELLCSADVASSDRVCDLKRFISKLEGTPVAQQKLLLAGQLLQCESEDVATLLQAQAVGGTEPCSSKCLTLSLVRLTAERVAMLKEFELGTLNLDEVRADLRDDPECVLAALKRNPSALKCAPEALRNNREFLLVACKMRGGILEYVPDWAQKDREIVIAAVKLEGRMLHCASDELKLDYEVVRCAVEQDGAALRFVPDALRCNAEIVLAAVEEKGAALEYADETLKGNHRIVRAALMQDREGAAQHVTRSLLEDYKFGAVLEDLGHLEDSFFDRLFWAKTEVAKEYFDRGDAVFLDARPLGDFIDSHIEGAFSMPISTAPMDLEDAEGFAALMASGENPIIVYSDHGYPASRCVLLQMLLRSNPKVQKFRVLRLTGGLNTWKRLRYPVYGDTREMLRGVPVSTRWIDTALRIRQ